MKRNFAALIIMSSVFFSCNSAEKKQTAEKEAYEQAKESIEETEKKSPINFLRVSNKDKRNLLGQTVIKLTVSNIAKVCSYKDILVELSFFSKTGTLLEKDKETIFESIAPGKEIEHKTKYYAPKATDSVSVKVLAAKIDE